jgi:flagellar hook protein FlgE
MGLASALNTALTGLSVSETTIDVVGNNLANSNTVGFKQSRADFATQFLQTMSLGSAPTDTSGGTNPRQTGLGAMVAQIAPDFTQGTIQISSSPTDLAIQGEGFFIVQGGTGEHLYTRNGTFKLNSENEVVSITGQRLLGYGVDDQFHIDTASLKSISIPLGSAAVAQATRNVYLEGQLSPTLDVANEAERIQTAALGNNYYTAPDQNGTATLSTAPNIAGWNTQGTTQVGGSMTPATTYEYQFVYANRPYVPGPPSEPPALSESTPSGIVTAAVGAGDGSILLQSIPTDPVPVGPSSPYTEVRIYRRTQGGDGTYHFINEVPVGTTDYLDTMQDTDAAANPALDETQITGKYKYYVTFATAAGGPGAGTESRVSLDVSPTTANLVASRVVLTDLPKADPADGWTVRRIYRSLATDENEFHFIGETPDATSDFTLTDNLTDAEIATEATLDMDGPRVLSATKLIDVLRRDTNGYTQLFHAGTLDFTGQKGGRTLTTKELTITADSTVQDLMDFMTQSMGIQSVGSSQTDDPDVTVPPGGNVDSDGHIILTGNNGVDNKIQIDLSGMSMTYMDPDSGSSVTEQVDMRWTEKQAARGPSPIRSSTTRWAPAWRSALPWSSINAPAPKPPTAGSPTPPTTRSAPRRRSPSALAR